MFLRMDWRYGQGEYDSGVFAFVLLTWSFVFAVDCHFHGRQSWPALVYLLLYHGETLVTNTSTT